MATISAKKIKKPRVKRCCDDCGEDIVGEHFRLYGAAHKSDKPYTIYICRHCAEYDPCPKIKKALAD